MREYTTTKNEICKKRLNKKHNFELQNPSTIQCDVIRKRTSFDMFRKPYIRFKIRLIPVTDENKNTATVCIALIKIQNGILYFDSRRNFHSMFGEKTFRKIVGRNRGKFQNEYHVLCYKNMTVYIKYIICLLRV